MKIIEELIEDIENYYNINFDERTGGDTYLRMCLQQLYLAGKISGLKKAIKFNKGAK